MKRSFLTIVVFTFVFSTILFGQTDTIYLTNPSFEDFPRAGTPPHGWRDCGWKAESPPDTQPSGIFEVVKPAFDGQTYLGMVVRDNETWESVGQRLSQPMVAGKCYEFTIMLARSELYVSQSRIREEDANYTTPVKLKIYGGFNFCDRSEVLGETKEIINHRWLEYRFKFEPTENFSFIMLEAFYKTPTLFPYNGNVLLDKASAIIPVPCDESLAVEETPIPPPIPTTPSKRTPKTTPTTPKTTSTPPKQEPQKNITLEGVDRSEMKEGQVFRLKKVYFKADSTNVSSESYEALDLIFDFLHANKDVIIEVGGHTNSRPNPEFADKLSRERAKSVKNYLVKKGIDPQRIKYKGYGKRNPIATNSTLAGRKLNQRVEIKILSFNG